MPVIMDIINHPLEASVIFSFSLMCVIALRWKTKE
jgi:hypothetical protein